MALAFRAGEIDVVPIVTDTSFASQAGGAKLIPTPTVFLGVIGLPVNTPPWSDLHVRRAVAYAINRADLIRARGGGATKVSTLIPRNELRQIASNAQITALIKSLNTYPFSLAK